MSRAKEESRDGFVLSGRVGVKRNYPHPHPGILPDDSGEEGRREDLGVWEPWVQRPGHCRLFKWP